MAGLHLDDTDGSVLYSKGKRRQNNNSNNLKKHQNKNQNSPKKFKSKCHGCNKYGHKCIECNFRREDSQRQSNMAVLAKESHAFTAVECLIMTNWNDVWRIVVRAIT
ncbi:unnamed protein product [Lasius platythorax]|uniref:CCHC-type domain-containing protein n=1 Tax=Lasius platythorax TaxID=488582 RepID=A0AAV2NER8_9HYME